MKSDDSSAPVSFIIARLVQLKIRKSWKKLRIAHWNLFLAASKRNCPFVQFFDYTRHRLKTASASSTGLKEKHKISIFFPLQTTVLTLFHLYQFVNSPMFLSFTNMKSVCLFTFWRYYEPIPFFLAFVIYFNSRLIALSIFILDFLIVVLIRIFRIGIFSVFKFSRFCRIRTSKSEQRNSAFKRRLKLNAERKFTTEGTSFVFHKYL